MREEERQEYENKQLFSRLKTLQPIYHTKEWEEVTFVTFSLLLLSLLSSLLLFLSLFIIIVIIVIIVVYQFFYSKMFGFDNHTNAQIS